MADAQDTLVQIRPSCDVGPVITVSVAALTTGTGIRQHGLDEEHVGSLVELDGEWPPILVWGRDLEVLDGAHRVEAAKRLGQKDIAAQHFFGSSSEALVESIHRNAAHGLPLSRADRVSAAARLLESHGQWSDRWIAELCGLSAGTVGRLREQDDRSRSTSDLVRRIGRDGRSRPARPGEVRERVLEALAIDPDRSLRAIASEAGASPETVRLVRLSLIDSDAPAPVERTAVMPARDHQESHVLRCNEDLALSSFDAAEAFTAWFDGTCINGDWHCFVSALPMSRLYEVADEARRRAGEWHEFARAVERRAR